MSEVDIAEDLPNGDDSAFADDQHDGSGDASNSVVQAVDTESNGHNTISAEHVYVATSQGLLTAAEHFQEANGLKTTHIVIHDQTLTVDSSGLKTPTTPIPPPTPATPLSREKGLKYQWDDSVHMTILPVRCKHTNGELHKAKFGSGGRGRCIRAFEDEWFTPNEFEAKSGRASSKDWKRSIRYGGRTLQCLIEDGILQPHATSCTCAACCDDESVTGPIRLFVPYKRRKKDSESDASSPTRIESIPVPVNISKKPRMNSTKSPGPPVTPVSLANAITLGNQVPVSMKDHGMMVSIGNSINTHAQGPQPIKMTSADGETVQIFTTDAAGNIITGDAVMMTPIPVTPKAPQTTVMTVPDVSEQRQWWQLEELVNGVLSQAQQIKALIEQAKQQSQMSRDAAIHQLKMQMDKEKQDALNAARMEAQMSIQRAVMEERAQKDIAVQQALATARGEFQEKLDSVTVVTCDKVSYNDSWTHQGSQNNIESIMVTEVEDDSDKEKE
ncbi:deformed epidermal autoregulatory factor 1 homolog isoform X2 [Mizuhopecten yessoensis]|uniref:Deformed epidermal autoregulatory factor 1-like n=1 Tax=Mizuhopecten yessoensis TaxID=6573 RepID=A0A210QJQ8_MIZYE|nr:deformed epidermal autoregulatory factor 1 homolog isoform X2 [Mizuhopecten yessoensis]OWF48994.1 Deformed epidermal autoregulatory factor 1-like [Mizuhopecten yessoensis]